ncbi:EXS family protein/ERD1/XPR1/SYG1 family protein [Pholiota molesta]|nr:EXS family protein/ERD1/XPR1/SYG1 family protein [Pholiota molesta]
MKFAQYLRDTQTPEWKKAYIDYRGLKKRITAIRKAQQGLSFYASSSDSPDEPPSPPDAPQASNADSEEFERSIDLALERVASQEKDSGRGDAPSERGNPRSIASGRRRGSLVRFFSSLHYSSTCVNAPSEGSKGASSSPSQKLHAHPLAALPLHELLTQLSPHEVSFFTMLDAQLDKVESFYLAREKEMLARGRMLQIQLKELNDHRKLFLEAHTQEHWNAAMTAAFRNMIGLYPPVKMSKKWNMTEKHGKNALSAETDNLQVKSNEEVVVEGESASTSALRFLPAIHSIGKRKEAEQINFGDDTNDNESIADNDHIKITNLPLSADPDSYLYAKRKLKKAVIEHYRGLEMLHNYRVLNITGFRKALKKFEKVTRIPAQNQYMTEKVNKSAFASDKAVRDMMSQMEEIYANAFGISFLLCYNTFLILDSSWRQKKSSQSSSRGRDDEEPPLSAFRSGLLLGLALPALIDGIVKGNFIPFDFLELVLPQWNVLLYVYGLILVPVLFTLLVGINLLLDVLTQLDHREYFENSSILLATLCYAFWFSFSLIGPPVFSPTTWPLIWLLFAFVMIFNPLPISFRSSRYWLIKHVARLFVSGTKNVEFTDFWMGDQFCSLIFTLSNIYFFICVYVDGFSENWEKCNVTSKDWPIAFVLASLPLFIRLVQSIKRYNDSKLITHLINDLLMDWSVLRLRSPHFLLRPELVYTNYVPVTNILIRFIWIIYIPQSGPSMMLRSFIAGMLEMLRRWQWNFFRLENEHLGNMDQYRVTREVPLPYAIDERRRDYDQDDDDDDHHLKVKR